MMSKVMKDSDHDFFDTDLKKITLESQGVHIKLKRDADELYFYNADLKAILNANGFDVI